MKYTSRDTQSNLNDMIEDIKSMTHLWKPGSEADPGMILLKALAANVDLLSFNLDTQVSEMYLQSATQIKSIRRIGVANGYQPPWYRAPRTKITITNTGSEPVSLDFSFQAATAGMGNNQCEAPRNALENLSAIPYFIIPKNGIKDSDAPIIQPAGSSDLLGPTDVIYREAAQGILKSVIVNPAMLNPDGRHLESLAYRLPSQNVDPDLIWVQELSKSMTPTEVIWEYDGNSGFMDSSIDEAKYQVSVDDYNNLIILMNGAINNTIQSRQLIRIYYLETYGVAGEVTENTLVIPSLVDSLKATHPGNTLDIPDGSALTGRTPMTAHEAAVDARNWINTNNSIITLPNFTAWIKRQPGISTGIAVDCQKAFEINWGYRYDENMDDSFRNKKYLKPGNPLSGGDFPNNIDSNGRVWDPLLGADVDFPHEFLVYKLIFFSIFNNFLMNWNDGNLTQQTAEWAATDQPYRRYRPGQYVRNQLKNNYLDTYNLSCSVDFGFLRVFEWKVNGVIYTKKPISTADAEALVNTVMSALRLRFNAINMDIGVLPRMLDVVECVQNADSRIQYFDAGLINKPMIEWCPVRNYNNQITSNDFICDIDYFNHISFARFIDGDTENISVDNPMSNISVARECILPEVRR